MPLYQRVVAPDRPGLFFIGFIQTVGAEHPAATSTSPQWVGDLLTGAAALPSAARDARSGSTRTRRRMAERYVRSDRHTMQVDYWRYIRAMKEARATQAATRRWLDRLTRPLAGLR